MDGPTRLVLKAIFDVNGRTPLAHHGDRRAAAILAERLVACCQGTLDAVADLLVDIPLIAIQSGICRAKRRSDELEAVRHLTELLIDEFVGEGLVSTLAHTRYIQAALDDQWGRVLDLRAASSSDLRDALTDALSNGVEASNAEAHSARHSRGEPVLTAPRTATSVRPSDGGAPRLTLVPRSEPPQAIPEHGHSPESLPEIETLRAIVQNIRTDLLEEHEYLLLLVPHRPDDKWAVVGPLLEALAAHVPALLVVGSRLVDRAEVILVLDNLADECAWELWQILDADQSGFLGLVESEVARHRGLVDTNVA